MTRCAGMTEQARRERRSGLSRSGVAGHAGIALSLLAAVIPLSAGAQQLSPQEVFQQVAPSVVVVEVRDYSNGKRSKLVVSGSGVVIPGREKNATIIATNCHVVDKSSHGLVSVVQGETRGTGRVVGRDAARDLCVVHARFVDPSANRRDELVYRKLPAVRIASSQWLEVGDPVYAIGAPQSLELTLSNGIVSAFRKHEGTEYIQTTTPISKGSSGGGLFDAQGRLVGITTMFVKDAQALNFAVPAELIASVPEIREADLVNAATDDAIPGADTAAEAAAQAAAAADAAAAAAIAERSERPRNRWWTFYEDREKEIAFDTETSRREGRVVMVWKRSRYENPQRLGSEAIPFVEALERNTFYCGSRQYSINDYVVRNDADEVVASSQLKSWEIERTNVVPGTIGETAYKAACELVELPQ